MIRFPGKKSSVSAEVLIRMIWVSSLLAMVFTLPALGIFLGIYYGTGQVLIGAVLGFGVHFVTLAFSPRISKFITRLIS